MLMLDKEKMPGAWFTMFALMPDSRKGKKKEVQPYVIFLAHKSGLEDNHTHTSFQQTAEAMSMEGPY